MSRFDEVVERITEIKKTQKSLEQEYDSLAQECLKIMGPDNKHETEEILITSRADYTTPQFNREILKDKLRNHLTEQLIESLFEESTVDSPRSGGIVTRLK